MDSPKKILIVDDDEELCSIFKQALEEEGYIIFTAQNGKDALVKIKVEHFDLIITDKNMPQMGGLRLTRAIRKENPNVKIVLITGFGGPKSYINAMELGADEYLNKPFRIKELKKFVANILNQQTPF
jgi:two-component system response regulator (stage 0 sporulation protein F)